LFQHAPPRSFGRRHKRRPLSSSVFGDIDSLFCFASLLSFPPPPPHTIPRFARTIYLHRLFFLELLIIIYFLSRLHVDFSFGPSTTQQSST
jgi:hypothetical protein